jgi:hypothetical protein
LIDAKGTSEEAAKQLTEEIMNNLDANNDG